jgi:hypothetical protein
LWLAAYFQYILKMRSNACMWENIGILSGAIVNEDTYFRQVVEVNNPALKVIALQ